MKLKSWDGNNINDGTNYDAVLNANFYGLPGIRAVLGSRHGNWPILAGVERPGRELNFDIYIRSGSSLELAQWFDPEDETAKQLIVEDSDGSDDRFVNAICTEFREVPYSAGLQYAVTVMVDGDVRWREIAITTASAWSVTATGQTKVVANGGQDKAYPILKIVPTSSKSVEFQYKRFIIVKWNEANSATNYPVDIVNNGFDTDALTTAKMQADGDDLRVYVDGVEVDRWLQDIDTATTQVWVNLDFQGDGVTRRLEAVDISQTTIQLIQFVGANNIDEWPNSGIVLIESELITYTGKNNQQATLTGCTRGAKGTTAATHAYATNIYWIQHDIWIYYGDDTLTIPTVDDGYEPMIELASTNASWDYDDFKEDANPNRPGSWQTAAITAFNPSISPDFYGGNQDSVADPYAELGIDCIYNDDAGRFYLYNPCGITSANFTNGEKWAEFAAAFSAQIQSSINGSTWANEYTIPAPSADETWEAWSQNPTLDSGSNYVGLYLFVVTTQDKVEAADVTLVINNPPTCTIGAEQANYPLSCIITNNTTGDAIEVTFGMLVDDELEINTDEKTVIYLEENSNKFNALDLAGCPRVNWLPLDVGNNTLQFDDVGTGNVTITVTWWERYYE